METFEGVTALVTGSTKGIGFVTAQQLLTKGAIVTVHGRTRETVDAAVARLGSGDRLSGVAADLVTIEGCEGLVAAVGDVDVLVNNCGVFEAVDWMDVPEEHWRRTIDLNALSGYRLTRALLPKMIARGRGRVIFVSSESARTSPSDQLGPYAVTKGMQLTMMRLFAQHARGSDVTVNAVLPGPTVTESNERIAERMMEQHGISIAEARARILATRPPSLLERMTTTAEVAHMIVYLASAEASGTTGAEMRVDGGVTVGG